MDLQRLLKEAQKMKNDLTRLEKELQETEYTGAAGGEGVKVVMNGNNQMISIDINPDLLGADDKEMLEDLIKIAVNEATKKAADDREDKMGGVTGGISMPGLF
ncbi:MAG: YbaB/EbfC family nucleoid-associated protein [Erysipelotrichaceae bacterium]|nr:YbaB/EbfC family nucleoid-associated protein [Erysipelotrichaceae bacterium]